MNRRRHPPAATKEIRDIAAKILDIAIRITEHTDAEVTVQFGGWYDTLLVSAYTQGMDHFKKSKDYKECRYLTRPGGADLTEEMLSAALEDIEAFAEEIGYDITNGD